MNDDADVRPKPVVLVILDGWGHRDERGHNAIAHAYAPAWERLVREYPHGLLNASESFVGLPEGQMGNSEVGHMNIGSGRVVMQDLPRIDAAIADGSLARHARLAALISAAHARTGVCHLLGLLSPGGVHSHQAHMATLANIMATQGLRVCVHAFLDGRDTPPQSALEYLEQFEREVLPANRERVQIATAGGRYYAMDRDKRWERVRKAYDTLAHGDGPRFSTVSEAVNACYDASTTDEFVPPCAIGSYAGMRDGDGLVMANFRADRAREILSALLDPDFAQFARGRPVAFCAALGLTEYSNSHNAWMQALFPPEPLTRILGEEVARAGLKQLRIAETEKYAHVTFFFNGGRETEFEGEERILVPSPQVATYDLQPEMSAPEVTSRLVEAIEAGRFDFIVVNYANTDMVGHTGDMAAATRAVEAVDACLQQLCGTVEKKGGAMLITADHGNAEQMFDPGTAQAHTAHTLNLVPVIIAAPRFKGKAFALPQGRLGDVAPTILQLLRLPQPPEMTGRSLLADTDA